MTSPSLPPDRLKVLARIAEYEQEGGDAFFRDVEDDPPGGILRPGDVDYLHKTAKFRVNGWAARVVEQVYKTVMRREFAIKLRGAEHLRGITGGAIFTSNHFSPAENLTVKLASEQVRPRRRLYKLIKEGNFFAPGLFGFLFRYCDTLPLSSDTATMVKLDRAIREILARGDFILIYPEQSMWWNYRKPRPYKPGAFVFAAKNGVPVVPCFVTLGRKNPAAPDGPDNIAYTSHIGEPIYPDPAVSPRADARRMSAENAAFSRAVYEEVYGEPPTYGAEKRARP